MLKIHLAQIFFNPAYYDSPIDFLEEPSFLNETDCPLGRLRSFDELRLFLAESKNTYINHLRSKVIDIVGWSATRSAHILAFPEYSIPYQLLLELRSLAVKHSMVIIAGTHRIPSDEDAKAIYKELGIQSTTIPVGTACAPTIFPDGSVKIAPKLKKSKWEANLNTLSKNPEVMTFSAAGNTVRLAVVPCVDSLHPEVLGTLWGRREAPEIIICPSLSPSVELFHSSGSLAGAKDTLVTLPKIRAIEK
jgi:hypothetical protein